MSLTQRVYGWITEEYTDSSTSPGVSETASEDEPTNFLLNLSNGAATKLAEKLASPDLVLVWLLRTLGAPVFFSGLLEPIRRGAATFPQLVVSARIRAYTEHKWFWVGAGLVQALALLVMFATALWLAGVTAGVVIIGALLVFSVASGVGSVAYTDVLDKTIPEDRRGQLLGLRSSIGGGLTIAAGLVLYGLIVHTDTVGPFLVLLGIAAGLWVVGAGLFALIREPSGETETEQETLDEARSGLKLFRQTTGFRQFNVSRGFLLSAELTVPFYALRARRLPTDRGFGLFIAALGIASLVGSPVWGRIADRASNRIVMILGGLMGSLAAAAALGFDFLPSAWQSASLFALVLVVIGFARSGVRVGRKSYISNAAPGDKQSLYTAASNTAVGLLAFAFMLFGVITQVFGLDVTFAILLALGLLGAATAWWMPEPDEMGEAAAS